MTRWYDEAGSEALRTLGTSATQGLSKDEAARRLAKYGANQLAQKPPTPKWKVFLSQFQDFMIYILFGAVIIAAIEGQVVEAIAIIVILLLNGVLGFIQEYRAEKALEALKQMAAPMATVIRDGVEQAVLSSQLVPGDIVLLEAGNTVPADGRLLEVGALRIVEAALTGESDAVRKSSEPLEGEHSILGDQHNMVFASTTVSAGHGIFVVTGTGQQTEMGKIATLLDSTEKSETPLQVELERVGKRIGLAIIVIAALVFIEGVILANLPLFESYSLGELLARPEFRANLTGALLIAIALAVAAIPEGLPAIVTVSLSLGVRRMAEKHAIMKRLHAVETLGSTTFICSDKTGTLTLNQMTVKRLLLGTQVIKVEGSELVVVEESDLEESNSEESGQTSEAPSLVAAGDEDIAPTTSSQPVAINQVELEALLSIAVGCNDAHYTAEDELVGDPTETALVACGRALAPDMKLPPRVSEIPFDSDRKRMSVILKDGNRYVTFVKGGFDTTLPCCTHALLGDRVIALDAALLEQLTAANEDFAKKGLRTLAFAMRENSALPTDDSNAAEVESGLIYVGLMASQDPARPEVPAAVRTAQEAGIKISMVTGDHLLTASAIAREIGILSAEEEADSHIHTLTGTQLEAMSDEELAEVAPDIRVYARVNPEHKIRIVSALKARGQVVAMTGDGVNDAPALKRADIGVAMGVVGTDVTREAADMVLSDDNFSTIVAAVQEGRTVFANLKKVIVFLLSCNVSEVLIVAVTSFFSSVFHAGVGLLPLQLLWINLITDGVPALALGVDPAEYDVMKRKPRDASKPILTAPRWTQIISQGAVMTAAALLVAYVVGPWFGDHGNIANAQVTRSMLFATIVFCQLLHVFAYRSETKSVFSSEALKNKWLNIGVLVSIALQVIVINVPGIQNIFQLVDLAWAEWAAVLIVAFIAMATNDCIGLVIDKVMRNKE